MENIKLKDKVTDGVKRNNYITRTLIYAFAIMFLGVLLWNYALINKIQRNRIVIDRSGTYIPYEIKDKESLLQSTIAVHCELTSFLVNSFDRINLKSNQAKALFLSERKSLVPIFEYYSKTGNYNKALKLGYTYENEFKEVESIDLSTYPYTVVFSSITKIYNGGILENEVLVKSTGKISIIEANFSQSPQGYYFTDYLQEYLPVTNDSEQK